MKIIFDNDATVTEYEKFIDKYAIPFFRKRYGLSVVNPNALELEDIFELKTDFICYIWAFGVYAHAIMYGVLSCNCA